MKLQIILNVARPKRQLRIKEDVLESVPIQQEVKAYRIIPALFSRERRAI